MNITTTSVATELLVELAHIGVEASVKGERISLQPASRLSAEHFSFLCTCKAELMELLENPRLRWRSQAEALVVNVPAHDREDLLDMFDEREAIASVDGELDDHHAGQVAYKALLTHLREK